MNEKQHALAAEIRAEMAAQRITATEMQKRTGIKHASWRNWFVTAARPVPYPELEAACAVLGVNLSEMLRRAEARAAQMPPVAARTAELESGLSKGGRRALEEGRRAVGKTRPAEDEAEDPPDVARGKARRSA